MPAKPSLPTTVRSRVVLGVVGGALCAFGLSLILGWSFFMFLLHHMFVIGIGWLTLAFSIPVMFLIAGVYFAMRAFRN